MSRINLSDSPFGFPSAVKLSYFFGAKPSPNHKMMAGFCEAKGLHEHYIGTEKDDQRGVLYLGT